MERNFGFILMILLAALTPTTQPIPPSWHNWFLPVLGSFITILLSITVFFAVRWMNKTENQRVEDMTRLDEQRKEDLLASEKIRQDDHTYMREAIDGLTIVMQELTNETKKKAIADARFEEKIFYEVRDFHEKMSILTVNVQAHEKAIADISNEIKNIKKRHKANHNEEI